MTTASDFLRGRIMQEWIDGTSIQRASKPENRGIVDVSITQELFDACVGVFFAVWPKIKSSNDFERYQVNALKEVLGNLHLFSVGFQEGELTRALSQSDELRDSILEIVSDISQSILNNFVASTVLDNSSDLVHQVTELRALLNRSKFLLVSHGDDGADNSSLNGDGPRLLSVTQSTECEKEISGETIGPCTSLIWDPPAESTDGSNSTITTTPQDHEASASNEHPAGSCTSVDSNTYSQRESDSESDSGDDSSSMSSLDIYSFLRCRTECLLDLVPTMERSLTHALKISSEPSANKTPFSITEAARPFVLKVADKFTNASKKLIERLGEANWQRYVQIRERMDETSNRNHVIEPMQGGHSKHIPQSVFAPCTLFHDSGIGTSVATVTEHAASVASHTSFISSNAEEGRGSLRVPTMPAEVSEGKPFQCFICKNMLFKIRTRVDWKIHVFSDLKPYICTVDSCPSELTQFPTRKLWEAHEFNEHRNHRTWRCPFCPESYNSPKDLEGHLPLKHDYAMSTLQLHQLMKNAEFKTFLPVESHVCPLCGLIPGKSQRNFATHLGRHMETIALAVLPPATEDDSDGDSIGSTSDHRTSVKSGVRVSAVKKEQQRFGMLMQPQINGITTVYQKFISSHPGPLHYGSPLYARPPSNGIRSPPAQNLFIPPSSVQTQWEDSHYQYPLSDSENSENSNNDRFTYISKHPGIIDDESDPHHSYDNFDEAWKARVSPSLAAEFHPPPLSERPEKCPIATCDYHKKGFARKYDKERHVLTHYKGTMVCGFCPGSGSAVEKSFNRADVFKRHLTSLHGVKQSAPNSRKKSSTSSTKRATSEPSDTTTGKCSTCGITFNNPQDFYEHLDECVFRVIQQGDKYEAINERHLARVANDDAVQETLARNMLPSGLESAHKHTVSSDEVEGKEDGEDGQNWSNNGGDPSKLCEESDASLTLGNEDFTPGLQLLSSAFKEESVHRQIVSPGLISQNSDDFIGHCKKCSHINQNPDSRLSVRLDGFAEWRCERCQNLLLDVSIKSMDESSFGQKPNYVTESSPNDGSDPIVFTQIKDLKGRRESDVGGTESELNNHSGTPFNDEERKMADLATQERRPLLECPFNFLDCFLAFVDSNQWFQHSIVHFGRHDPPSFSTCGFCNEEFRGATGMECWRERMTHVAIHYGYQPRCRLAHARPDLKMFEYLRKKHLVSAEVYKNLLDQSNSRASQVYL